MKQIFHIFHSAILSLCLASVAWAQFETAVVLGTVRDPGGAVIPGVKIALVNVGTGIQAETATAGTGDYIFLNVRVGRYTLTAEKEGFQTARAENVQVTVNARQRVDFAMLVGAVTETVDVSANVMAVDSDSSDRGLVVGARQIVQLPLNVFVYRAEPQ